jgi:hypothetical protein
MALGYTAMLAYPRPLYPFHKNIMGPKTER